MANKKYILWFRRDLRVADNRLLSFEGDVLPIFIFDTHILNKLSSEDKRVSLLYEMVLELKKELQNIGLDLKIFYGKPLEIIDTLLHNDDFDEIIASGDYDSYAKERDLLVSHKIHFKYLNETYLFKPKEVMKDDGIPYLVFTPFYKKALVHLDKKDMSSALHKDPKLIKSDYDLFPNLQTLGFQSYTHSKEEITPSLDHLKEVLANYETRRDNITSIQTSKMSIALRFGRIGIRQLYNYVKDLPNSQGYIRQLIFRDFYAYLLFHFPYVEEENFKYRFKGEMNETFYQAFIKAQTGYPIIDAGVVCLKETGNIPNRLRMIMASFFCKHLLLPWQEGEKFFAQYLLDYDAASNILSWQWSASTGVDAQPYFRVFNPYIQSKKFDKNGEFIKKYLPQLEHIEAKKLYDEAYLKSADIKGYVKPIVDQKEAKEKAIERFKSSM